jgi:hypothetical protein
MLTCCFFLKRFELSFPRSSSLINAGGLFFSFFFVFQPGFVASVASVASVAAVASVGVWLLWLYHALPTYLCI